MYRILFAIYGLIVIVISTYLHLGPRDQGGGSSGGGRGGWSSWGGHK